MEISKERKEELLETHLLNYEMPDEQELAKLTFRGTGISDSFCRSTS